MGDDMTDTPGEGHEAWRRKVRRYVDAGNRGVEPCYVGREDLLRQTARMVESASNIQRDSRTLVISGAPGAGKSAYLREIERLWKDFQAAGARMRSILDRVAPATRGLPTASWLDAAE